MILPNGIPKWRPIQTCAQLPIPRPLRKSIHLGVLRIFRHNSHRLFPKFRVILLEDVARERPELIIHEHTCIVIVLGRDERALDLDKGRVVAVQVHWRVRRPVRWFEDLATGVVESGRQELLAFDDGVHDERRFGPGPAFHARIELVMYLAAGPLAVCIVKSDLCEAR